MRCAVVDTIGAGSAEIEARALRLEKAGGAGGAGFGCVGACSRFVLGRMNCRTGSVGAWEMEVSGLGVGRRREEKRS